MTEWQKIKPYKDNVLIAHEPLERQSEGGIWLDPVVYQRPEWMLARVLAIGPSHKTGLKPGDRIAVREHFGTKVSETEEGHEVRMLWGSQIEALATLPDGSIQLRDVRDRGM